MKPLDMADKVLTFLEKWLLPVLLAIVIGGYFIVMILLMVAA